MRKVYEIHDSLLQTVDQQGDRVSIQLRALLARIGEGKEHAPEYLRQEIKLVCEGAELSVDSQNLPSWLLEGSLSAESEDSEPADRGVKGTIPASLRSACGVELVLAGLHEESGDFVTIRVKASSLTLETLGEAQSMQYTRASN